MDFHTLSSKDVINDLTCALCNNFLSYFPVYNCDNRNICGRCILPEGEVSFQNQLYEVIAQWLRFPCRYKGCDEEFLPEDMPQHEETCVHRTIRCAMDDSCHCDWTGGFLELIPHCRSKHVDKILQNGEFEVALQQNSEGQNLLEYNNQLLHVESKFDLSSKFFELAIYHLEVESEDTQYRFHLVLKTDTRSVSIEINTTKYNEKCFADVSMDLLRNRSEGLPTHIQAKISTQRDYEYNAKILKELECLKCTELIISPVFHCLLEKAMLCFECYKKHLPTCEKCELFSGNLKDLRVKNFEQIMSLCDYTCKNRKHGCTVVAKPLEMTEHYRVCPFREVQCVFNDCKWKDLIEKITSHIEGNHQDAIVNSSEMYVEFTTDHICKNVPKIIKFGGKMFVIHLVFYTVLCCFVQEIENPGLINYQMNIFHKNRMRKLVVTSQNNSCVLSSDDVKAFEEDNRLTFGIDILKHNI